MDSLQVPVDPVAVAPDQRDEIPPRQQNPAGQPSREADSPDDGTHQVVADLAFQRLMIANVVYFGQPDGTNRAWVLVDAGVPGSASSILSAAENRFGKGNPPAAIILTHGHFDHVGGLTQLAERWNVPVYAHYLEMPYLDGSASYPAPDPTVGGGLMSALSSFYPRGPINVGERLQPLPRDNSVPGMPGWEWIHAPGHTPGQIALWRETDRFLIAADAFITTRQESAYAVLTQTPELHGPPMYYTQNWDQARETVRHLATLEPEFIVTGHGPAMRGPEMRQALHTLARDFDRVAVPTQGVYVENPATAASGTAYQPAN
ncbi:MAG: MBL fold metallo-hydrolase [Pirellulales bacterium]|nr:MBL fold metallo-hydrolase [Pirellulales bacterium]